MSARRRSATGAGHPKNIAVTLGTAAAISTAGLSASRQVVVLADWSVLVDLGVAAPIVATLILGDRADTVLDDGKAWLTLDNAAMATVTFLFFGVFLMGKNLGSS